MDWTESKKALKALQMELYALRHASGLLMYDGETCAPKGSTEARGLTLSVLSARHHELLTREETARLVEELLNHREEMSFGEIRQLELLKEQMEDLTRIPKEEYVAYTRLINASTDAWVQAKTENRFDLFEPYLSQVVEQNGKLAAYHNPALSPYDSLLDQYEKGMTTRQLDSFFGMLRREVVPLLEQARQLPEPPRALNAPVPVPAQRELAYYLMDVMGIDRDRCILGETEHPFTEGFNRTDVRITTHYHENMFLSSMYSVIHEGGHALYELNLPEEYAYTPVSDAPSLGLHESQSRFYENLVGHHPAFLELILPKLKELAPQVAETVSPKELLRGINDVRPSLVRTEADQVTYPLHIMVRYEIEKELMQGKLSVKELPEKWNAMYREYLGVEVPDDRSGVLQDIHWAQGMIGYFPTYALGSAYASQFYHAMEKELDPARAIRENRIGEITAWLTKNIHSQGNLYPPMQLLERATGEGFNPAWYVAHLKNVVASLLD